MLLLLLLSHIRSLPAKPVMFENDISPGSSSDVVDDDDDDDNSRMYIECDTSLSIG